MTATARVNVTGNARAEIAKITEQTKALAQASASSATSLGKLEQAAGRPGFARGAKGAGELASNARKVETAARGASNSAGALAASAVKADIATRKASASSKTLAQATAQVTATTTRAVASTTSYARATNAASTASKAAATDIKRVTTETVNYTRATDAAANAAKRLEAARRVSNPFSRRPGGNFTPPPRAMTFGQRVRGAFTGATNTAADFAGGATAVLGTATTTAMALGSVLVGFGAPLALAVREASQLDTAMSRVRAASMASRREMTLLTEQAAELGASTQFSAAEVGRVQENYAKAGFSIRETLAAVPAALSLAGATDTDTGFSSGLISQVIRSIGFEANQSGMISDNLVTAANVSNVDVTDLAETMKYAAPVFAGMNREDSGTAFRDLSALSGILGDQGIRGSMAGTGLRTGYLAMASPTARASRAMAGLGVSATDEVTGNVRRMPEILADLRTALEGKDTGDQSRALRDIFGAEGAGTFAAILSADASRFDELVNAMENSGGAAERTARIMQDNLAGDLEKLGGSMGGLGTTIGTEMLPGVRHSVQSIGDFVDAINGAIGASDRGKGVFESLGEALADTVDGFRVAMERILPPLLGALESLGVIEPGTAAEFAGQMAEASADSRIDRIHSQAANARDQINMDYTREQQALSGVRGKVGDAEGSTGQNLASDVRRRLEGAGLGDLANVPEVSQALGQLQEMGTGAVAPGQRRQILQRIQEAMTPEVENRQRVSLENRDERLGEVDRVEGRNVEAIEGTREAARQGARTRAQIAADGLPFAGVALAGLNLANLDEVRDTPVGAQARTSEEAERHLAALARATTTQTALFQEIARNTRPPNGGGTGAIDPQ